MNKNQEPNFLDKKWHLSTKGIWHKVRNYHYLCKRAVGRVKPESFDIDRSITVCKNCMHLLVEKRGKKQKVGSKS